jgi:hypothetical protein
MLLNKKKQEITKVYPVFFCFFYQLYFFMNLPVTTDLSTTI